MRLVLRVDRHRAEDAGEAPHVLTFQIRTVGESVHLGGDDILSGLQEPRDIELGRVAGIFGEADVLAVDPQVEERVDAVKVDEDLAAGPARRDFEVTPVGADGVAVHERGEASGRFAHHARPVAFEEVGLV